MFASYDNTYEFCNKKVTSCEIRLNDGRHISIEQRKRIYATMRDISEWCGYTPDEIKQVMKYEFIARYGGDEFSLSDCDMTIAREFLTFLIEFCVENDVPCFESLLNRCEDIDKYLYSCVANRRCAICGGHADIHEVETVGMGRNRKTIHHNGQSVQPLCREHHTELGTIGQDSFDKKYHMQYIRLDDKLCEIINWKK